MTLLATAFWQPEPGGEGRVLLTLRTQAAGHKTSHKRLVVVAGPIIDYGVNMDPDERLARLLADITALRDALQHTEYNAVHLAHDLGMSWDRIGEAHDPPISGVRAAKRYSHPKPRRSRGS